jgi:hypothetical protein
MVNIYRSGAADIKKTFSMAAFMTKELALLLNKKSCDILVQKCTVAAQIKMPSLHE